MNIGINILHFKPGKVGGTETYLRNLLENLQTVDTTNEYTLILSRLNAPGIEIRGKNFRKLVKNYSIPSTGWFCRGVLRNTLKVDILRTVYDRLKLDVIHHPFTTLNPNRLKTKSILTFHDMQHEFYPEFFSADELEYRRQTYRPSAEEAIRIVAISEHVKSCLVERYQLSPDKIDVIYNGFSAGYRIIDDPSKLLAIKNRYGLTRPFLYYPAATWPHKNHKKLLMAVKLLIDKHDFDGDLVLSGANFKAHSEVMQEASRLGLEKSIKALGYLPYEDLPALFNLARIMVYPSLFEGFGIPLVEAMACGCPVICSDRTSLPEVAGDAALQVDPTSPEDIAEKIWAAWNDESTLDLLRKRGLARAAFFSWEEMARKTLAVYRKTVETSR